VRPIGKLVTPSLTNVESKSKLAWGTYLIVRIDVEDPDEVVDVYAEKLLSLQVDEELPLYIIPVRP
jgi:hypothetical protein